MFWTIITNIVLTIFAAVKQTPVIINHDATIVSLKPNAPLVSLAAKRGAVLAANDRYFLFTFRADEAQPIASITKLMTALVFLDNNPGWDKVYTITPADKVEGGRLNLFPGDEVKVKDLFYTALVASDNGATIALVHATGISTPNFVKLMNDKARELGLNRTSFEDPIGLSDNNVSTAREVALMAQAALKREEIRKATVSREYKFTTAGGLEKNIESTDYLLYDHSSSTLQVLGGKTGYTDKAGYCFVGWLKGQNGQEVISVVLNSGGKNDRFKESKGLANWTFSNYIWSQQ